MMANFTSDIAGYFQICSVLYDKFVAPGNLYSKRYFINHIALLAFSIFTTISTIILNLITILTFRASNQMKKKTYNYLIYIQSIIDLGAGIIVTPLFSTVTVLKIVGNVNCELHLVFLKAFLMASGFSMAILSAMNFERYASIVHPIYHRNKVTKKRLSIYVTVLCMLFVAVTIVSIPIGHPLLVNFIALASVLHLLSTVYLYWKIFSVGKAQLARNNQTNSEVSATNKDVPGEDERARNGDPNGEERPKSSNRDTNSSYQRKHGKGEKEITGISNIKKEGHPQGSKDDEQYDCPNHDVAGKLNECTERLENHESGAFERLDRGLGLHEYKLSNEQTSTLHPQDNESKHQAQNSGQEGLGRVGDEHKQPIAHNNGQHITINNRRFADKRSTQEVLTNLKLAKSCLLVVICSFISFLPPPIFSQVVMNKKDGVILSGWCIELFLLNATLDSLIFFWKNRMLRTEAIKTLKKISA